MWRTLTTKQLVPNQKQKEEVKKLEVRNARMEEEKCVDVAMGKEFVERNKCVAEEEERTKRARTTLFFRLLCLVGSVFTISWVLLLHVSLIFFFFPLVR